MPGQMVDCKKGQTMNGGDGFRRHHADNDAADQTGTGRCRHTIQLIKLDSAFRHGLLDYPVNILKMSAGGDFRNDAAERPMIVFLGQHNVRQYSVVRLVRIVNHRSCSFVTTGFNS